jgi:hypothetical protein
MTLPATNPRRTRPFGLMYTTAQTRFYFATNLKPSTQEVL